MCHLKEEWGEEVEDGLGEGVPQELVGEHQPPLVVNRLLVEILPHVSYVVRVMALRQARLTVGLSARVRQVNLGEELLEAALCPPGQLILPPLTALLLLLKSRRRDK